MSADLLNLDELPSWDHIDAMVDYDPLRLRDVAWQLRCEVERLRCRLVDRDNLEAKTGRLNQALSEALATIDRVAHVRRLQHGCTDGTTTELVLVADLREALGLTSDGTGVSG